MSHELFGAFELDYCPVCTVKPPYKEAETGAGVIKIYVSAVLADLTWYRFAYEKKLKCALTYDSVCLSCGDPVWLTGMVVKIQLLMSFFFRKL